MTPGKVGELFKAHFIKTNFGVPQKNTMPIVAVEQFYTLLGLTCLGLLGISHFEFGLYVLGIAALVLVSTFQFSRQNWHLINSLKSYRKFHSCQNTLNLFLILILS